MARRSNPHLVGVRCPDEVVAAIDALIREGKFASRGEAGRHAMVEHFTQRQQYATLRRRFQALAELTGVTEDDAVDGFFAWYRKGPPGYPSLFWHDEEMVPVDLKREIERRARDNESSVEEYLRALIDANP